MVISYHGCQFFKVSFGDTTLAFDPIAKGTAYPQTKFGADIALVSLWHPHMNGVEQVSHGTKEPFVIQGPGEYECGAVTVRGYGMKTVYDKEERYTTIYQVRMEDMNLVFLGALGTAEIDPKILSELGDIDILFIPIGGGDVLDVPAASKLAVKLEAHLILPMHYDKSAKEAFIKEIGSGNTDKVEKLTLKKKEVQELEGEVRFLEV